MIVRTLWIKRTYSDREGIAPELLVAWDSYAIDENYEGFEKACQREIEALGSDYLESRIIDIHVKDEAVFDAFKVSNAVGEVR